MPVLGVCRNAHGFASFEFLGFLAFDLVVASTTHCDEHLGSAVMHMPVVAASRLEGNVVDGKFRSVEHLQNTGQSRRSALLWGMRLDFP